VNIFLSKVAEVDASTSPLKRGFYNSQKKRKISPFEGRRGKKLNRNFGRQ
jgi:hypothetical protein